MPQLDVSSYPSQIFWLIICFLFILWSSSKFLLPQVQGIFGERWRLIEGRLEEAKILQSQAEELCFAFQKELDFSRKRAHEQILSTSRQISVDMNKKRLEFAFISKEKFRATELRILEKKSAAMGHVQAIAQDLTSHISTLLLETSVPSQIVEDAVTSSITKVSANDF